MEGWGEVDALCLMCRVTLPAVCAGPSANSVSGWGVGLVCWVGLLLVWVGIGDRSGGEFSSLGGVW